MNHDVRFKMLLKIPTVLRGFFDAFLPHVAEFVDFQVLEFVDKERHTLGGRKRTGDLLIKTRFRGRAAGFLIHLEHQAQPDPDLARRMLEYFALDWRDFDLPVYPVAVLSHKKPAPGLGLPLRVDFPSRLVLHFDFDVVDLARMDAGQYLKLDNLAALALAARMKIDPGQRPRFARDFLVRLGSTSAGSAEKKLATEFYFIYQPLSGEEALQLERELSKVQPDMVREKAMQIGNPFIRWGIQRGLEKGLQKGRREGRREGRKQGELELVELVLRQLKRRLGVLSANQAKGVRKLRLSDVEALGEALLEFNSSADLARWLRQTKKKDTDFHRSPQIRIREDQ